MCDIHAVQTIYAAVHDMYATQYYSASIIINFMCLLLSNILLALQNIYECDDALHEVTVLAWGTLYMHQLVSGYLWNYVYWNTHITIIISLQ